MTIFERFGGRKFLLSVGCALITSILVWFGKIDGTEYVSLIGFTVGAYIAGGTLDNIKKIKE